MIHVEALDAGIRHIEFRRPEQRNALNEPMYLRLAELLRTIPEDPEARVIVVSGAGAGFCAGNDRGEFTTHWPQPEDGPVLRCIQALHDCELPLVAAVHGAAVGIGATMLLHCDAVFAAENAFLQYPFVDLGLACEAGSSYLLPRLLGRQRAMDILLTSRRVPATEALALGLVTGLTGEAPPLQAALDFARPLAGKSRAAVAAVRRLVRQGADGDMDALFRAEIQVINDLLTAARATGGARTG